MQCPNDGAVLTMSERSGIEIDYCPTCRGVWLDRGELDKIIERSLSQPAPAAAPAPAPQQYQQPPQQGYDRGYQQGYGKPYKKRKESWLSELFD
jgi:Zn-finger nucleic acid-binding protein